jgi:hypothetical protein
MKAADEKKPEESGAQCQDDPIRQSGIEFEVNSAGDDSESMQDAQVFEVAENEPAQTKDEGKGEGEGDADDEEYYYEEDNAND